MMKKLVLLIKKDHNLLELIMSSLATFFSRGGGLFLNYLFIFAVSRFYGAEVLGLYALGVTILHIFSILGKIGMDVALMKYVSVFSLKGEWDHIRDVSRKSVNIVLPFSVFVSLLIFVFSTDIAVFVFHKEYLDHHFRIAACGIVPNIFLLIYSQKLRGFKEIGKYSFLSYLSVPLISFLIFSASLVSYRSDYLPVSAYVASTYISLFIGYFLWRRSFSVRSSVPGDPVEKVAAPFTRYREMLSLALPIMLTNSLVLLMGWTDTIMLGIFKTTFEVGVYRIPLRLAAITATTLISVNSILGPKVSEFWTKGDLEGMARVVRQATMIIFWLSLPVLLVFWVFPGPVLGVFGSEFKSAIPALIILSIGQFFNAIVGPVGTVLIMTGRQLVLQNIVFFGSIVNIALNYLLIPDHGINGAAFASMISMIIVNLLPFFYIKKKYGFYTLSRTTFLPIRILNK